MMNAARGSVLLFIFATFMAVAFQNCVASSTPQFSALTTGAQATSASGSGNGDSYDGKPDAADYARLVPNLKCGNQLVIPEILRVDRALITLRKLDFATCGYIERTVTPVELSGANYNRDFVGLAGGIFEKIAKLPDAADRSLPMTEAWCRMPASGGFQADVLVKFSGDGTSDEVRFYYKSATTPSGRMSLAKPVRTLLANGVKYESVDFELNLRLDSPSARMKARIGGERVESEVSCRFGGRLDTIAPTPALSCPQNYLPIPSLAGYISNPFCVAKYEAKNVGGEARFTPAGVPWDNVSRNDAAGHCSALGPNFDLVMNSEFQTIARNIEGVSENWSAGQIGSAAGLSRGHSDNSPGVMLEASPNDDDSCFGTEQTCNSLTWNSQRRTLRLSNGALIWDLAGNADEWLKDDVLASYGYYGQTSLLVDPVAKNLFGPAGNYSSRTTRPFAGLGFSMIDSSAGALRRGASFQDNGTITGGLFNAYLWDGPNMRVQSVSFRCVYHP